LEPQNEIEWSVRTNQDIVYIGYGESGCVEIENVAKKKIKRHPPPQVDNQKNKKQVGTGTIYRHIYVSTTDKLQADGSWANETCPQSAH
jgi:hypothetical protein